MTKIKLLLVAMTALVTTMAVLAAPAMAEFEAATNTTQGKVVAFPGKSSFLAAPGGQAIVCKNSGGEPWAEWDIQVKQQNKQGGQDQTKKGPHELLQIKKWGVCTGGPTHIAATVKCNLQVEQGSQNGSTGSVPASGCSVVVGPEGGVHCTVKVAAQENKELSKVKLENAKSSQGAPQIKVESNVTGITSTFEESPTGECATLGITTGKEGTFTTEEGPLITEGQTLV